MKQSLTTNQATNLLMKDKNANWSYDGAKAIIEYLEEMEEAAEEENELDVVAIRCEFSEYLSLEQALEACPDCESLEEIKDHTLVLELGNGGIVLQDF